MNPEKCRRERLMKKTCAVIALAFLVLFVTGPFLCARSEDESSSLSNNEVESAPSTAGVVAEGSKPSSGAAEEPSTDSAEMQSPSFEIPPEQQLLIGVKTVGVAVKPLRRTIRTVGRIAVDERKLATVNIKFEGWVEKLYADYTGKYVQRGEALAEIWSPEVTSVQLEYLNLLKWKGGQIPRFQRIIEFDWGDRYGTVGKFVSYDPELLVEVAKQKFKLWEFTDDEIRHIEERNAPFQRITIRSPINGYVFQKPAFEGTRVSPGDKIFDIVDLSTVWVLADLYEYELPFVKVGQSARIFLSYFPEKAFRSNVDFIYPSLSGQTRTVKARFIIQNPELILKPQMFADVEMEIDLGARLAIPRDAFIDTGLRQLVYVDQGEGYFQPRQVNLGVRADKMVEVTQGLQPGERIASRPVFLIDSEAKLKGVTQ